MGIGPGAGENMPPTFPARRFHDEDLEMARAGSMNPQRYGAYSPFRDHEPEIMVHTVSGQPASRPVNMCQRFHWMGLY